MNRYEYKLLQEYYKELFRYKGRIVADTEHSISQFKARHPHRTFEEWKKVVEDGIDLILTVFKDKPAKYIIVSRSKNIAIQLHWRRDGKNPEDKKYHGFSATTLDYATQKDVMDYDTQMFVEYYKKEKLERWFESTMSYEQMIKKTGYYGIKIPDCRDYKMYIHDGEIKRNFQIVEVE